MFPLRRTQMNTVDARQQTHKVTTFQHIFADEVKLLPVNVNENYICGTDFTLIIGKQTWLIRLWLFISVSFSDPATVVNLEKSPCQREEWKCWISDVLKCFLISDPDSVIILHHIGVFYNV